jgi:predicted metal-binding membrane protein
MPGALHAHGATADPVLPDLVAMWMGMMTAMMAPSVWPWIRTFYRLSQPVSRVRGFVATTAFAAGYFVVWAVYSVGGALAQVGLLRTRMLGTEGGATAIAASIILVGAGVYQLLPIKRACLTHCRSPLGYFLARWRSGGAAGFGLGLRHGWFCVGCCWALMATGFATGLANHWWMAAAAVAALVEQVAPHGDRIRVVLGATLIAAGVAWPLQAAEQTGSISPDTYIEHVRFLASDELGGRQDGTPGLERAAAYIERQFNAAGLAPGGESGTFGQSLPVDVRVEPPAGATLDVQGPTAASTQSLVLGRTFYPLSIIDRGPHDPPPVITSAPLVFAGFGISAPALGYDDFAGLDVTGAAVAVFTHEPQEHDLRSPFAGQSLTPNAALTAKARLAREHGAAMLIVIEDPSHGLDRAIQPNWWNDPQADEMEIPVVRVSRDRFEPSLVGADLAKLARRIDLTLEPQSRRIEGVTVSYTEGRARVQATVHNVVGILPGSDAAHAREAVVVGAHYDHVGTGGRYSEAPEATGDIHNGADDNASGTAALIELAKAAAHARARFGRTIVFVAFAGEEIGLLGSSRYVDAPAIPLASTKAMINLDMIGRAHGRVMVGVFGRAAWTAGLLTRMQPWTRLTVTDFSKGGYSEGSSDDAPFERAGVPAVAFFTGFHADYHRPSDDWQKIDAEGASQVASLALELAAYLSRLR